MALTGNARRSEQKGSGNEFKKTLGIVCTASAWIKRVISNVAL
jgi:hypothetical protein